MSFPANSSKSIAPGEAIHQVVQPHTLRSAISPPESLSARIGRMPAASGLPERWNALQAIKQAYRDGRMSETEYGHAFDRIVAATLAHSRHVDEFTERSLAGATKPGDYYREIYGYTEEETQQAMQAGALLLETRAQNESRCRSRILQNSQYRRGTDL